MSRCFRRLACTNMRDYDIKSCMFSLVVQLVDKAVPKLQVPAAKLASWRQIAANRSEVCASILCVPESEGKQLLIEVANGATPPPLASQGAQDFLQRLSSESRFLRQALPMVQI